MQEVWTVGTESNLLEQRGCSVSGSSNCDTDGHHSALGLLPEIVHLAVQRGPDPAMDPCFSCNDTELLQWGLSPFFSMILCILQRDEFKAWVQNLTAEG